MCIRDRIYAAMFGTNSIFQMPAPEGLFGHSSSFVSYVFLISIVVFGLSLLFAAITDQKLLKLYTATVSYTHLDVYKRQV